ncbi:hypothetical protein WSK_3737 [Novosphingobium sp. Rr 2-17]|uniref:DUF6152 family protein n=1 Tax=Novosphingobium sp. Rr 2-17 TaxID=555793 RepID=UPI000269825A|nr:DUF6152 family protein [Novosphingobium sp. Rr 2-17]EIZ77727.1 hypothetical protein WSK_3737 [Novosphingobium sp. Rr 2-17]
MYIHFILIVFKKRAQRGIRLERNCPLKMGIKLAYLIGMSLEISGAQAAYAHHSFAAYDMARTVTVQATVKEFRWGAPHSSVVLMVKAANGQSAPLNLISGPPNVFVRQGITPKSVRVGDKVKATYHPNFNGSAGGALATLILPDGRTFTDQESFGAAPKSR